MTPSTETSELERNVADRPSARQTIKVSPPKIQPGIWAGIRSLVFWFDKSPVDPNSRYEGATYAIDWVRILPFVGVHLACFFVFLVGWSPIALVVAAALYVVHMFAITGFYHRYFSHRTFKTSRVCQFIFAVVGSSAVQRGPLWWSAHHRHHHRNSDQEDDLHSPLRHGFLWSHVGWVTGKRSVHADYSTVQDLSKFPELRILDRFDVLVPIVLAVSLAGLGSWLAAVRPDWGTSAMQMLIWGFFISTVVCSHATFTINSLTHMIGSKRYKSRDESRNSLCLALLTFGEGWHNNHHYYPGAVRQGFYWWEIDMTFYALWLMSKVGLIWDLNPVPLEKRESNHINTQAA